MKHINRSLLRYLDDKTEGDFRSQVADSRLLLAVLNRFVLDGLHSGYVKMLKKPIADNDAALALAESLGEQKVLYRLAQLFSEFNLDDHPLIKDAKQTTIMGGVTKGD